MRFPIGGRFNYSPKGSAPLLLALLVVGIFYFVSDDSYSPLVYIRSQLAQAPAAPPGGNDAQGSIDACSKGNYSCKFGSPPPKGQEAKGICMYAKPCNATPVKGSVVTSICIAEKNCKGLKATDEEKKQPAATPEQSAAVRQELEDARLQLELQQTQYPEGSVQHQAVEQALEQNAAAMRETIDSRLYDLNKEIMYASDNGDPHQDLLDEEKRLLDYKASLPSAADANQLQPGTAPQIPGGSGGSAPAGVKGAEGQSAPASTFGKAPLEALPLGKSGPSIGARLSSGWDATKNAVGNAGSWLSEKLGLGVEPAEPASNQPAEIAAPLQPDLTEFGQLPDAPLSLSDPAEAFDKSAWEEALGKAVSDPGNLNPFSRPFPDAVSQTPGQGSWLDSVSNNAAVFNYQAEKLTVLNGTEYFDTRISDWERIASDPAATEEERATAQNEIERLSDLRVRAEEIAEIRSEAEAARLTRVDAEARLNEINKELEAKRSIVEDAARRIGATLDGKGWLIPANANARDVEAFKSSLADLKQTGLAGDKLFQDYKTNIVPAEVEAFKTYRENIAPELGLQTQLRQAAGADTRALADASPELAFQKRDLEVAGAILQSRISIEPRTVADFEARNAAQNAYDSALRNYYDAALARVVDPTTGQLTNPEAAYRVDNETVARDVATASRLAYHADLQNVISEQNFRKSQLESNTGEDIYNAIVKDHRDVIDNPNSTAAEIRQAQASVRVLEERGPADSSAVNYWRQSLIADADAKIASAEAATAFNNKVLTAITENKGYGDLIARAVISPLPTDPYEIAARGQLLNQAGNWTSAKENLGIALETRTRLDGLIASHREIIDNPNSTSAEIRASQGSIQALEQGREQVNAEIGNLEGKMAIANQKLLEFSEPGLRSSDSWKTLDTATGNDAAGSVRKGAEGIISYLGRSETSLELAERALDLGRAAVIGIPSRYMADGLTAIGDQTLPFMPSLLNPFHLVAAPFSSLAYGFAPTTDEMAAWNNMTTADRVATNMLHTMNVALAIDPFSGLPLTRGLSGLRSIASLEGRSVAEIGSFFNPRFEPSGFVVSDPARYLNALNLESGTSLSPPTSRFQWAPGATSVENFGLREVTISSAGAEANALQRVVQGGFDAADARLPTGIADAAAQARTQIDNLFRTGLPDVAPAANANFPLRAVGADISHVPPDFTAASPAFRDWTGASGSRLPATYAEASAEAFKTSPISPGREIVARSPVTLDDGSTIWVNQTRAGDLQTVRTGGTPFESMSTEQLNRSFARLDDAYVAAEKNYQQAVAEGRLTDVNKFRNEVNSYDAASRYLASEKARLDAVAENRPPGSARDATIEQTAPCPINSTVRPYLAAAPCGGGSRPSEENRATPRPSGTATSKLAPTDAEMQAALQKYQKAVADYNALEKNPAATLDSAKARLTDIRAAESEVKVLTTERKLAENTGRADNFKTTAAETESRLAAAKSEIVENLGSKFAGREPIGQAIGNAIAKPIEGLLPPGGLGRVVSEIGQAPFRYTSDLLSGRLSPVQALRGAAEGALRTAVLTQNLFAADVSSAAARTFLNNARVNITEMASVGVRIAQDISPALRFGSALDTTGARIPTTAPATTPSLANLMLRLPIINPIQGLVQPLISGQLGTMLSNLNLFAPGNAAYAPDPTAPSSGDIQTNANQVVTDLTAARPDITPLDVAAELNMRGFGDTSAFQQARDLASRDLSPQYSSVDSAIAAKMFELRGLGESVAESSVGNQPISTLDRIISVITPSWTAQGQTICSGYNCGGHKYSGIAMDEIRRMLEANDLNMGSRTSSRGETYATYPSLAAWLASDIMKRQAYISQNGWNTFGDMDARWAVPDKDHTTLDRQKRLAAIARAGLSVEDMSRVVDPNDVPSLIKMSVATACAEYSQCDPNFVSPEVRTEAIRLLQKAGRFNGDVAVTVSGSAVQGTRPAATASQNASILQPRQFVGAAAILLGRMLPIGPDGTAGGFTAPAQSAGAGATQPAGIAQPVRDSSEIAKLRTQAAADRAEVARLEGVVNAAEAPASEINTLPVQIAAKNQEIRELESGAVSLQALRDIDALAGDVARQLDSANANRYRRGSLTNPPLRETVRLIMDDIAPLARSVAERSDIPEAVRAELNKALNSLTAGRKELQAHLAVYDNSWFGWRRPLQQRWNVLIPQLRNDVSTIAAQMRLAAADEPQKVSTLRGELEALTGRLNDARAALQATRVQRDAKNDAIKAAEAKIAELERNAEALQSQIDAKQAEIANLRTEAGNLQVSSDPNIAPLSESIKNLPSTYAVMEAASKAVAANPSKATGKASLNATRAYVNAVQQAAGNSLVSPADRQTIERLAKRILGIESAMQKDLTKLIPNESWLTEQANVLSGGEAAKYKGGLIGDLKELADNKLAAALAAAEKNAAAAATQVAARKGEIESAIRQLESTISTLRGQLRAITGTPESAAPAPTIVAPDPTAALPSGSVAISSGAPATEAQAREMVPKLRSVIPRKGMILPFSVPNPRLMGTANDTQSTMITVWPSPTVRGISVDQIRPLGFADFPAVQTRHLGPQRATNQYSGVAGVNTYISPQSQELVRQGVRKLLAAADRISDTEYVLKPGTDYAALMRSITDAETLNGSSLLPNQNYVTADLLENLLLADYLLGQQGFRKVLSATTEQNHGDPSVTNQHFRGFDADVSIAPNNFAANPAWFRDPAAIRGYAAARDAQFAAYLKAADLLGFDGVVRGGMYASPNIHIGFVPRGVELTSGRRWDQNSTANPFGRVGYTANSYAIQNIFDSGRPSAMTWDTFASIRNGSIYKRAPNGETQYVLFDGRRSAGAPFVAAGPPAPIRTAQAPVTLVTTPTPYAQLSGEALAAADRAIEPEFIQRAGQLGVPVQVRYDPSMKFYQQRLPYEQPVSPMTHGATHHTGPGTFAGILAGTQRPQTRPVFGVAVYGYHLLVENCAVAPCKTVLAAPLSQRTNHVSARPRNENTGQLLRLPTAGDNYSWNSLGVSVVAATEGVVTKAAAETVALLFRAYGEVTGQPNFTQNVLPHSMINPKGPGEGHKAYQATRVAGSDTSYAPRWAQSAPAIQTVAAPTRAAPTVSTPAQATTPVPLKAVKIGGNTMYIGVHGDPTKARVVWYNHGNDGYRTVPQAFEQLRGSNVIFVAPHYNGGSVSASLQNGWSRLRLSDGFKDVLREVAPQIARAIGNADLAAAIPNMEVFMAGFSGGGSAVRYGLTTGGITNQVRNVLCLDCIYGDATRAALGEWMKNEGNRLTVAYNPSTKIKSEELRRALGRDGSLGRATIRDDSAVPHRDMIVGAFGGNPLAKVVGVAPAARAPVPQATVRSQAGAAEMVRIHAEGFAFVVDGKVISAADAAKIAQGERGTKIRVFKPAAAGANTDSAIQVGERAFVDSGNLNEFLRSAERRINDQIAARLIQEHLKVHPTIVAAAGTRTPTIERATNPSQGVVTFRAVLESAPAEAAPRAPTFRGFSHQISSQHKPIGTAAERGISMQVPSAEPRVTGAIPRGMNSVIRAGATEASKHLPPGYSVRFDNSARNGSTVGGSYHVQRNSAGEGLAVDMLIYNEKGEPLAWIRSPRNFQLYREFMQNIKHYQDELFPLLRGQGRWGGYFVGGVPQDLMHYDLGPTSLTAAGTFRGGLSAKYAFYGTPDQIGQGMGNSYKPINQTVTGESTATVARYTLTSATGERFAGVAIPPGRLNPDGTVQLATLNGKLVLDKDGNPFPIGGGDGGGSGAGAGGGTGTGGGTTPPAGGSTAAGAGATPEQQVFATDAAGNKKLIGYLLGAGALGLGGTGVYFVATNEQGEPVKPPEKVADTSDPKLDPGTTKCDATEKDGELGIECTLTPPAEPRKDVPRPPRTRTSNPSPYERRPASQPRATPVGRPAQAGRPAGGAAPTGAPTTPAPVQPPSALPRPASTPLPGNKTPYAPGSCTAGTVCGNNTLYIRDTQCFDQSVRACQYGCQANTTNPTAIPTACAENPQSTAASCTISITPRTVARGATTTLAWSSTNARSASITPGIGAVLLSGSTIIRPTAATVYSMTVIPAQGAATPVSCVANVTVSSSSVQATSTPASIVLVANPKNVRIGERATIGWITTGMRSCTVSSPTLPQFTTENAGIHTVYGTTQTPALTSPTMFQLSCQSAAGVSRTSSTIVDISS